MSFFKSWPSVLGHTAGFVTPNVSWFKALPCGRYIEVWKNIESAGYTAVLIAPAAGYKPGQLYVAGEMVDSLVFTRSTQLASTGWLPPGS